MPGQATDDVDLAVELINTDWFLADPPDRLTDVAVVRDILVERGEGDLAVQLRPSDLGPLRELRERLRPAFAAGTVEEAGAVLNPMLREAGAVPQLVAGPGGTALIRVDAGLSGYAALAARLPAGVAAWVAAHGPARIGVCQAAPCACVFVDRTRPGTRRYCCDACNDRAAAAAYRLRKRT
jgi:predicted RNA-binding Zn ribbon-like protein